MNEKEKFARIFKRKIWRGLYRTGRKEWRDIGPIVHRCKTISCTVRCRFKHLPKSSGPVYDNGRNHVHFEDRGPALFYELNIAKNNSFVMWLRADLIPPEVP